MAIDKGITIEQVQKLMIFQKKKNKLNFKK